MAKQRQRAGTWERVADAAGATALAGRILDPARERPLVLVSTPMAADAAGFDLTRLCDELAGVADVVEIETGDTSRVLERLLPPLMQAYGGAARSYPPGLAHDPAPRSSPLRFVRAGEVRAATEQLVADAFAHAAVGMRRAPAAPTTRERRGVVRGVVAGGARAIVELDDGTTATVCEGAGATAGVPLEWMLAAGTPLAGTLTADRTLELAVPVPTSGELAERFPDGDVTLALVVELDAERATLAVHPAHPIEVRAADVSSNPLDRVDLFFERGEVVPARVLHEAGALRLRLSDVDDDETVHPALPLVPGGPPWLVEGRHLRPAEPHDAVPAAAPLPASDPHPAADAVSSPDGHDTAAAPLASAPSPADLAAAPASAPVPSAPEPDRAEARSALRAAQLKVTALEAEVRRLRPEAAERLRIELRAAEQAKQRTLAENGDLVRRLRESEERERAARAARGARREHERRTTPATRRAQWPDDEGWLRHEIACAWVERIDASEKASTQLPDYELGPEFAGSLDALDAAQFAKAMKAAVDVLTGLAARSDGRELHRLRSADAGGSPYRTRDDGAVAWRCAIERNTPSARRLHYWQLPGGGIELARVGLHDDMEA